MIHVAFDPRKLTGDEEKWWDKWIVKAEAAIAQARADAAAGVAHQFKQPIWAELKVFLLTHVFHGKCAYCETFITPGFVGDAEHYRPKGEVRVKRKIISVGGKPHPGYYWLAYHWKNLIPACERCNSTHKGTEFPVSKRHCADQILDPDALDDAEDPLLLHPYSSKHDPEECLVFGVKGMVAARDNDPRGLETIRVCGLDRDDLTRARQRAQESAIALFGVAFVNNAVDEFWNRAVAEPYFSAVRQFIFARLAAEAARRPAPEPAD